MKGDFDVFEAILMSLRRFLKRVVVVFPLPSPALLACLLRRKSTSFYHGFDPPPPPPLNNISKNCKIGILRHPEPSLLAWPKFHSNLHLLQQKRTGHKGSFCTGLHRAKIGICEKTRESIGTFVTEEVFGI